LRESEDDPVPDDIKSGKALEPCVADTYRCAAARKPAECLFHPNHEPNRGNP
jgi:hypothetical protein